MERGEEASKLTGELGASVRVGEIVSGKYEIERVLGAGGMGVVVAAKHLALGHRVALKFLREGSWGRPDALARFHREARAAAKLRGEHVARIHDVDTLPSGAPCLVMEHLVGRDLAEVLRTEGPLPIERAVSCVLQACDAIAEAHATSLVHRDLKPSNLFLVETPDGAPHVKVLDFGIAKQLDDGSAAGDLTGSQGVLGSPQYMSPEQVRASKLLDERTDVWSLGAVLYELLAGKPPFRATTVSALLASIAADPPGRLLDEAPQVPEALAQVVARCLEKSPSDRYPSVAALAAGLSPFASDRDRALVARIAATLRSAGADTLEPESRGSSVAGDATASANVQATGTDWGRTNAAHQGAKATSARRKLVALTLAASAVAVSAALALRSMRREAPVAPSTPDSALLGASPAPREATPTAAASPTPLLASALVAGAAAGAEPSAHAPASAASSRRIAPRGSSPSSPALPGRTEF